MITKLLFTASMASGLIIPNQAEIIHPPKLSIAKPAIVKAENIEFSKNMLAMPLTMGMLAGGLKSVEVINRTTSPTLGVVATSTVTYTAVPIGTARSTRRVLVLVNSYSGSTLRTVSSATIGGVAATIHLDHQYASSAFGCILSAVVPTGTDATVVINYSGSMSSTTNHIWAVSLDGVISSTAISTPTASNTLSSDSTMTFDLRKGGYACFWSANQNSTGLTYSGWTAPFVEFYDATITSTLRGGIADALPTSGLLGDFSVTFSATATGGRSMGISLR